MAGAFKLPRASPSVLETAICFVFAPSCPIGRGCGGSSGNRQAVPAFYHLCTPPCKNEGRERAGREREGERETRGEEAQKNAVEN